jgi:hypothetical protein
MVLQADRAAIENSASNAAAIRRFIQGISGGDEGRRRAAPANGVTTA